MSEHDVRALLEDFREEWRSEHRHGREEWLRAMAEQRTEHQAGVNEARQAHSALTASLNNVATAITAHLALPSHPGTALLMEALETRLRNVEQTQAAAIKLGEFQRWMVGITVTIIIALISTGVAVANFIANALRHTP